MRRSFAISLGLGLSLFLLSACGDDDKGGGSSYPTCNRIVAACEEHDDGSNADITLCNHDAQAATSDSECAPLLFDCLTLCSAADGDGGQEDDGG